MISKLINLFNIGRIITGIRKTFEQWKGIIQDDKLTNTEVGNFINRILVQLKLAMPASIDTWIDEKVIPFFNELTQVVVFTYDLKEQRFTDLYLNIKKE